MQFHEWIDTQIADGLAISRRDAMSKLAARLLDLGHPVSVTTLGSLDRGARLRTRTRAEAIERATGGAVRLSDVYEADRRFEP